MKFATALVVMTAALIAPAMAQSPPAAPAVPDAAAAPAGPAATPGAAPAPMLRGRGSRGGVKAARMACRAELKGRHLKGPEKWRAVTACVIGKHPEVAQREQCRLEAAEKGLRGKDDRRAFMGSCLKGKA